MRGSPQILPLLRLATGESPLWCDRTATLWFVDIHGKAIHRYQAKTGVHRIWHVAGQPACLALTHGRHLVVGMDDGFHLFDPSTGDMRLLAEVEIAAGTGRLNDGAVSRGGRFFAASLVGKAHGRSAQLYRLDEGRAVSVLSGLQVGNGLAFSADDSVVYLSDSAPDRAVIMRAPFDARRGQVGAFETFYTMPSWQGRPDGGAVDAEGFYWSAAVGGGRLVRLSPQGAVEREVALPVERPTKICFGGDRLQTIYVVSIGKDAAAPNGSVLSLDLGITGLPEPRVQLDLSHE